MRKLIILIIAIIFSCSSDFEPEGGSMLDKRGYNIIVVDSCEYLYSHSGMYTAVLAHKGNCKFCKARR